MSKPKFRVGQIVINLSDGLPVKIKRIRKLYDGIRHYDVSDWRFPQSEDDLRRQTAKEIGPRRAFPISVTVGTGAPANASPPSWARTTAPKRKSPVARKRSNKNSSQKGIPA